MDYHSATLTFELRRDYRNRTIRSLLINTAIAAERQKEKPEVFWKRNES